MTSRLELKDSVKRTCGVFTVNGEQISRGVLSTLKNSTRIIRCGTCGNLLGTRELLCSKCTSNPVEHSDLVNTMVNYRHGYHNITKQDDSKKNLYNRPIELQDDDVSSMTSGWAEHRQRFRHFGPPINKNAYVPTLEIDPEYCGALAIFNYKTEKRKNWEEKNGMKPSINYLKFIGNGELPPVKTNRCKQDLFNKEKRLILYSKKNYDWMCKHHGTAVHPVDPFETEENRKYKKKYNGRIYVENRPLYSFGHKQDRPHHIKQPTKTTLKVY